MSSVMRPVGDKPPNIYWRRRIVALVVLLIVVVLVVWVIRAIIGAVGGSKAEQPASVKPSAPVTTVTAPASPTESSTEGVVEACAVDAVSITATSDSKVIKVGQVTKVGMQIENTADKACTLDAGSANLELVISSGSERIWSSDDCQKDGESKPTEIPPTGKLASEVPWDVTRSAEGCATGQAKVKAGTYQLTARVGEMKSAPLTLTVEAS